MSDEKGASRGTTDVRPPAMASALNFALTGESRTRLLDSSPSQLTSDVRQLLSDARSQPRARTLCRRTFAYSSRSPLLAMQLYLE